MHRSYAPTLLALLVTFTLGACGSQAAAVSVTPAAPTSVSVPTLAPPATVAPPPNATPRSTNSTLTLGVPFQLAVGQTAALTPGLRLTFADVAGDSRCPAEVSCAWGGAADVLLDVAASGQPTTTLKLRLYGTGRKLTDEARGQVAGLTVTFTALDPYPHMATPTRPSDYVVTLLVKASAPQPAPGGAATPQPAPAAFQRVEIGSATGFLVPEGDAQGVGERTDTYWTPNEAAVRAMEAQLAPYLRVAAAPRSPELWQKQATYTRQYIGLVRQGHKLIYTNFFCNTSNFNDLDHYVSFVADGGDCFFQTTYDVERQTFVDVQINGNA